MPWRGGRRNEETCRRINGGTDKKHFKYTQVFNNHFRFRHVVDDHNNFRMMEPCIEKNWHTIKWECRLFSFILAISEVNAWLTMKYFCGLKLKLLQFSTNLARELILIHGCKHHLSNRKKMMRIWLWKRERVVGSQWIYSMNSAQHLPTKKIYDRRKMDFVR